MIEDELEDALGPEYSGLPEDEHQAFLVFESRLFKKYNIGNANTGESNRIEYIQAMESFVRVFGINFGSLGKIENVRAMASSTNFPNYMVHVRRATTEFKARLLRERSSTSFYSLEILKKSKAEIRELVGSIKSIIEGTKITPKKKDSLFKKLNIFLDELDREMTRLSGLLAAMVEVSSATGEAAKELEPAVGLFERIMKAVGRGAKESTQLPPWETPRQLPSPPKQLPAPSTSEAAADGDLEA